MKLLLRSLFAIAVSLVASTSAIAAPPALPGDSVYQVEASVVDQDGRAYAWQALRGRPRVVTMFYAHCHLMCPLIIASGKSLQGSLDAHQREELGFVSITLDPARDTPAALLEVAQMHRLDDHWRLLRPGDADVRTLAAALGVRYRAQPDGTFNHTSVLILLDRDGRIVARSEVTDLTPDPRFVATVREYLAGASASGSN